VATVTRVYRQAFDSYLEGQWEYQERWGEDLRKVFNRGFDTGFYFQKPYHTSKKNQATRRKKDIGKVVNYYAKVDAAEIHLWDDLKLDDEIIIQGPTTGSFSQRVESLQVNHQEIQKSKKGSNVGLKVDERVRPGDIVYLIENIEK
jgi:putative protease